MISSNVYLLFNGTCRQAVSHYAKCFGVDVQFMPYSAGPGGSEAYGAKPDDVMHVEMHVKGLILMASDCPPGNPAVLGTNYSIALTCESIAEQDQLFAALAEGGRVKMPLADAFWGDRFGMLTDAFGVHWMLAYKLKA